MVFVVKIGFKLAVSRACRVRVCSLLSRPFRARPADERSSTCGHKLGREFPSSKNSHCQVNAKGKTFIF